MSIHLLLAATALTSAQAQPADPLAPLPERPAAAPPLSVTFPPAPVAQPVPPVPPPAPVIRVPRNWNEVFSAIRGRRWAEAYAGIATLPPGSLSAVARAELYTAKGSPMVSLGEIQALLAEAPDLPQAEQLARLAAARGALVTPTYIVRRPTVWLGNAPTRSRARAVRGEPMADQLRAQLDPLVKVNDAINAELLLMQAAAYLSYEARAEAGQRVAWTYYSSGRDADARRVADSYRYGAGGEWATQSAWVSGLASWRLNDCNAASRSFREVATRAVQRELSAGGYYWTARAEQACRRPSAVAPLLKAAARSSESFYGLLARETLGTDKRLPQGAQAGLGSIESLPNVRRARELVRIGQPWLAEQLIKHQAQIGRPGDHQALVELTKSLDLPSAQYWLAHNGQRGARVDPADRYPMPRWSPRGGWRVDPALVLAHMRQESSFRVDVVSPAGAVGLMQVLPGTAAQMARRNGISPNLLDPLSNMAHGQSFIEAMRTSSATQGQLPKIIAAYNAGPLPVGRWAWLDRGDPLLWIESIPYWETRYYVPAVLRNLWVYQGLAGAEMPTLNSFAQHRWPAFPTARTNLVGGPTTPAGEP